MEPNQPGEYIRNMTYAIMAGQSGCSSVVVIFGLLLLGLWMDSIFDTRPAFTLVLLLLSIPLSLGLMLYMVLGATSRITPPKVAKKQNEEEEHES